MSLSGINPFLVQRKIDVFFSLFLVAYIRGLNVFFILFIFSSWLALTVSFSNKAEGSSQEVHISHNTFLK